MIRVERDPHFWLGVVQHPVVASALGEFTALQIAEIIARPNVLPLASNHGGFLFVGIDSTGRVAELHTMYTPEGWGREVHQASKEAFERVFDQGVEVVVTQQTEANPRSQPPRSFGFRPHGDMRSSPFGDARMWLLTKAAWMASPARGSACH